MSKAAAILEKAADLVGKGWTQHSAWRDHFNHGYGYIPNNVKSRCMVGAIYEVEGQTMEAGRAYRVLHDRFTIPPEEWNDHPHRTQDDVVRALRKAAEDLE